ncbi:hypothetical protein N9851_01460 [Acidimicrobiia bacterium]|nr:hypothetical protein [Acidimicrobiia bacterium]
MFLLIYNGNLSMMNIRDFIFINKAKSSDRIKILELLGFESESTISQNTNLYKKEIQVDKVENYTKVTEFPVENQQVKNPSSIESYIKETEDLYTELNQGTGNQDSHPTSAFQPVNVTSKIKKIWSDVESRRQWVMPVMIGIFTVLIIGTSIGSFRSRSANLQEVIETNSLIASETNNLIEGLENVLEISTDTFYSKYDISNASAYLQSVESSTIEYKNAVIQNESIDPAELQLIQANLLNIFTLINDLDDLLTYRILVSEILVYNSLLAIDETTEIDQLTTSLSEITATSKRNYADLPEIKEMNNHRNLINTAIITAEDLHGRLLAALRNNEYEVVNSIASALILNKETEINAFQKSLNIFDDNKSLTFKKFQKLN